MLKQFGSHNLQTEVRLRETERVECTLNQEMLSLISSLLSQNVCSFLPMFNEYDMDVSFFLSVYVFEVH
jgi:hypothetical protein